MGKIPYQNFMGVAGYDDYSLNEWIPIDACNIRIREVVFHLTALQDTAHLAVRMTPPINGIRYAGCSRYSEADSRHGDPAGAFFRSMLLRDYVAMQSCEESCEISGPDSEVGVDKESELVTKAQNQRSKFQVAVDDKDERPLEGLHIVVDADNGAEGFFFAEKVLEPLGDITTGSRFLEPSPRLS